MIFKADSSGIMSMAESSAASVSSIGTAAVSTTGWLAAIATKPKRIICKI
jgi:hypothetical protein